MNDLSRCPICSSADLRVLKRYVFKPDSGTGCSQHERSRIDILFNTVLRSDEPVVLRMERCVACGLIFTNPRFTECEIAAKYSSVDEEALVPGNLNAKDEQDCLQEAARIFRTVTASIGREPRGLRILDYGGADGHNLVPFSRGNSCSVMDYVPWPMHEGIAYIGQTIEDLGPDDRFDLILVNHVVEHLVDPVSVLSELASSLTEEGLIYVAVPLGVFHEWRRLKEPLTHLTFFSEQSATVCLQKAGLGVSSVTTEWTEGAWSVVLVGCRGPAAPPGIRSTRRQMYDPAYALPLISKKLRKAARRSSSRSA